ncbi:MAG: Transcription termination/antitermination protein NusG [Mycoplasmataceae bacterium]|nr:MAG: Transcription termination/antitermination protein NusG [Mycoplasmataceae bacterium]
MNMHNYQWYILSVRGGRESKVIEGIRSELKKKGWENHVKELKVISDSNKKNILKGYIIGHLSLTPELVIFFYKIPEIIGFLNHQRSDKEFPGFVSQEFIRDLFVKTEAKKIKKGSDEQEKGDLNVGDLVKITEGVFIDKEGRVAHLDKRKQKVKIVIESSGWEVNDVPVSICQKVIV